MNNDENFPDSADALAKWYDIIGPPKLVGHLESGPLVIEMGAITPEAKAEFMRAFKEWATKPMPSRVMYADRPKVHPVRCGFVIPFEGDAIRVHDEVIAPAKLYRVFYEHGVYEWYVNDGPAPLWQYRKRGVLMGAGICAPLAR